MKCLSVSDKALGSTNGTKIEIRYFQPDVQSQVRALPRLHTQPWAGCRVRLQLGVRVRGHGQTRTFLPPNQDYMSNFQQKQGEYLCFITPPF
jgi:hypothetical protein